MKIKNVTSGNILISDLPNSQGYFGLSIPSQVEILVYNEDAEKSAQLGSFLSSGAITTIDAGEPSSGAPQSVGQPATVGAYPVTVTNTASTGKALVATSATTAEWQATAGTITFIDGSLLVGVVDGFNTVFTLANAPAANSLHLYKNGLRLRPTIDYTIAGQTITFTSAPLVTEGNLLADYRL